MGHTRSKRDSTTSYMTQSSSQDNHSRKAYGHDLRQDPATGTVAGTRSTMTRHHPIIRTPQTRAETDQTVFKIHKGAKTFDLCTDKNVLVTGGMDRVVRLWNPYLPLRPVARLRGHNAPVFLVKIAMEDDRLFSISTDKTVLVSDDEINNKTKILFITRPISYCYKEKKSEVIRPFSSLESSSLTFHKPIELSMAEVSQVHQAQH